jgi:hypothetical protein
MVAQQQSRIIWTPRLINALYEELCLARALSSKQRSSEVEERDRVCLILSDRMRKRFPVEMACLTVEQVKRKVSKQAWSLTWSREYEEMVNTVLTKTDDLTKQLATLLDSHQRLLDELGVSHQLSNKPVESFQLDNKEEDDETDVDTGHLTESEEDFRDAYAGKRLGVIGGEDREWQINKLRRLGVEVVWLPATHHVGTNGVLPVATANAIDPDRIDLLLLWTRCISHSTEKAVMRRVRSIRRQRGEVIPTVRSRTLNTDVLAKMFLVMAGNSTIVR